MVPNLLLPHPLNAPLLLALGFRASSLSSPRREIGLMKLKGMELSQHCGFQWHSLIHPPSTLLSIPPLPQPPAHSYYGTIYNAPLKRSLSHTWHQGTLASLWTPQTWGECWRQYGAHEALVGAKKWERLFQSNRQKWNEYEGKRGKVICWE